MKIQREDQILDIDYRKRVIKDIQGQENQFRKSEDLRRYRIYKDQTRVEVMRSLQRERLQEQTLALMQNRSANISIGRKIVDKLARCYVGGVERKVVDDKGEVVKEEQDKYDSLTKMIEANQKMKKSDRYRQLYKNAALQLVPERSFRESTDEKKKFSVRLKVRPPFEYDVIEDSVNNEVPRVFILSDFTDDTLRHSRAATLPSSGLRSRILDSTGERFSVRDAFLGGDNMDQTIADSPADRGAGKKEYIWWSDAYHFTTNEKGEILQDLSPEDFANPIGRLPFINVAEDQEGNFWAQGGDDLIDGSILVNVMLTDYISIANIQGYGQMVIKGLNLPDNIEGGPHKAIQLKVQDPEDPADVYFANANSPLESLAQMIFQYVAFMLSSNNLSVTTISGDINVNNFASGISRMIENAEAIMAIEDKQKMFQDAERKLHEILVAWQNYLFDKGELEEKYEKIGKLKEDLNVRVKFMDPKPVITEQEKLNNLKIRKELGLNELFELVMIDNPDLNEDDAKEKVARLVEEKMKKAVQAARSMIGNGEDQEGSVRVRSVQNDKGQS